jgi:putative endopeptidase
MMAAILQPPFFDSRWSEAANLGGIGFIIGHEIGHGFDDQGSQYGADGKLRNWWTDEDRKKFNAMAKRAMEHADAYEILPGRFLNGKLELGEIREALSGLHIAHETAIRTAKSKGSNLEKTNREFFEQAA